MIGYPNHKKRCNSSAQLSQNHIGRGMSLEDDLNSSNAYYLEIDRALIHKKPTPIQVVKVDYPKRSSAKIIEAYYKVPSTTDYNGIYRQRAIDFEAKETRSKTSFPFKSIHEHQIRHLERVLLHGGIGFFILRFTSHNETYLIDAAIMIEMYRQIETKSISYEMVKKHGVFIREGITPRLHYLDCVDELYFKDKTSSKKENQTIKNFSG
ncbi:MAG: Holliday junction resolvase RecU [Erysipelotrichaceae bacterium]|nr:Holliday junction resolvase RecU [Erysipelotrichaceae bacterium]